MAQAETDPLPKLSIVMPVYNEGDNIRSVLGATQRNVRSKPFELLIVYDFDEDNTVPVVASMQASFPELRLVRNHLGRGVLKALRAGFQEAAAENIVVMMADGSDEPQVIDTMLQKAAGGAAVVAGSRYMRGGGQQGGPLLKRTLSRLAGLSLHWFGGLPIHDATSNFRLYRRELLEAVVIESGAGFELALELTVKAYRLGLALAEVPTIWHDRTAGKSRFRMWNWLPHYLRWYRYGMETRLRRLRPPTPTNPLTADRS